MGGFDMSDSKSLGRTLAIIPAKAASQRVPRKNLRLLGGQSLLAWTVRAALACDDLHQILVSTEDAEVAVAAKQLGADVPFMRPASLAVDPAGVVEVCLHALQELEAQGQRFETLVILLPSSPFRAIADIQGAIQRYRESDADFLMSVSKLEHSPLSSLILDSEGLLKPLHPEWLDKLGAKAKPGEVPKLVRCNGAITIVNVNQFKIEKAYYCYPLAAYEMPWHRGIDIDTEEDLLFANFLLESGRVKLGDSY
jgi:CMP-N-acetylneuraminic acid synthetase